MAPSVGKSVPRVDGPAKAASLGFRFRFGNLEAALRDLLDRPAAA